MECCGRTEAGPAAVRRGPRLRVEPCGTSKEAARLIRVGQPLRFLRFAGRSLLGVVQFPAFVADRDRCTVGFLDPSDHPGVDTETFRDADDVVGRRRVRVDSPGGAPC